MAKFLSYLVIKDLTDSVWELHEPLIYESDILGRIEVPAGFQTDLASVPRVPIVYEQWGNRSHYEAVIHDWLYRIDSIPQATFGQANDVFLEAMEARGKPWRICAPMYWGVCLGGKSSYHKRKVNDALA
jgi:hypothetical protein